MRALEFLRTDDIPAFPRTAFRLERTHFVGWGAFAGIVEGNLAGIVVAQTFHASDLLLTVVNATPMLANMLSLGWGAVARGRRRMPLFLGLALAGCLVLGSIALTPRGWQPWGGWIFAAQILLARVFLAGLISVRTSIWKSNYPTALRARITGRLQGLRFLMSIFAAAAAASALTAHLDSYRLIYPLVGLVGALSLAPLLRLRVRGETLELRRFQAQVRSAGLRAAGLRNGLLEALSVLREDRAFARYCTAQFHLGAGAIMSDAVLSVVINKRLHVDHAPVGHLYSSVLLDILPSVALLLTISFWSRYFDRVGVLRFRTIHSAVWVLAAVSAAAAVLLLENGGYAVAAAPLLLLLGSRMLSGAGRSGGAIAWNLGHLHYAREHNADIYMGIHVALTGVRGVLMPFVGLWLFAQVGWWSMLAAALLTAYGMYRFSALDQEARGAER